jgi:DNA topoisomerase IB
MTPLRRVRCTSPGIARRRHGRGFVYTHPNGRRVRDRETLDRIRALAIPPAWEEVWICPDERGHLQAVGTDAAGRRQYLYHEAWRARRDRQKFDRVLRFAARLPRVRSATRRALRQRQPTKERVLAGAVRMLDLGAFRVGSESYAEENGSYGLATLRRSHVRVERDAVLFDYVAKGGKRQVQRIRDPEVARLTRTLLRRTGGGRELLAYREGRSWRDLRSEDINAYLKELVHEEISAKDFRTWHATVLAALLFAGAEGELTSVTSRKRVVSAVIKDVADVLGNTPAVCRASYVDPRVVDRFLDGETIEVPRGDPTDERVRIRAEAATIALLGGAEELAGAA